jgi:hypothetical protein
MLPRAKFRWKGCFCSLVSKGNGEWEGRGGSVYSSLHALVCSDEGCRISRPCIGTSTAHSRAGEGRRAKATDQALSLRFLSLLVRVVGWNLVAYLIAVACM